MADKPNSAAAKLKALESTPYNTLVEHVDAAGWRMSFGLLQQRVKWLQNFMEEQLRLKDHEITELLFRLDQVDNSVELFQSFYDSQVDEPESETVLSTLADLLKEEKDDDEPTA